MKIAVLQPNEIVAQSNLGKSAEQGFRKRIDALQKIISEQEREAMKIEAQARNQKDRREANKQAQVAARLRRDVEHSKREASIEIEEMRTELLHDVLAKAQPMIRDIAATEEIDLILTAPNPSLAFFKPEIDLTSRVVEAINAASEKL